MIPIKQALLSVANKEGIAELAQALNQLNIKLLATGNTKKILSDNKIDVTEVSDYTGFPEIMGGRVKTLHPKIHGGILGRRGTDDQVMAEHSITPIDLVIINLYPFAQTIQNPNCTLTDAIENIDIGGPTLLRAAAKNHQHVCVVIDPNDYDLILDELKTNSGHIKPETCAALAVKAFSYTAAYDKMISEYLRKNFVDKNVKQNNEQPGPDSKLDNILPDRLVLEYIKTNDLRYGENPHQKAALYHLKDTASGSLADAQQIQGKPLSYNNLVDADAAFNCIREFESPGCVIVKHANPCGVATADNITEAYQLAFNCDPTSAFGGIIAINQTLDELTAKTIIENQFVEVIIAPDISEPAKVIVAKKENVRVLIPNNWQADDNDTSHLQFKSIHGGMLIQELDHGHIEQNQLTIVTQNKPNPEQLKNLLFSWRVVKHVKSNAIVIANGNQTIGIGAGQTSRVDSTKIAIEKAKAIHSNLQNAVLASDAFFPFADSIELAIDAGIKAIIQPGGSMRDNEVIAAADAANVVMVCTGMRHFNH